MREDEVYFDGRQRLAELLEELQQGEHLIVGLCNMNHMQQINRCCGRRIGDEVLCDVERVMKGMLREPNFAFHLQGDEFVVVFVNRELYEAEAWAVQVLGQLAKECGKYRGVEELSFCYGFVCARAGQQLSLMNVISEADHRMYIQKRDAHIEQNRRKLRESSGKEGCVEQFRYQGNALFQAFSEIVDGYVFVGNLKTGEFLYSDKMVKDFGLPGQLLPEAAAFWAERIHPDDRRLFLRSNQEIADGKASRHAISYRAKNCLGEWVPLLCRGEVSMDADGSPDIFTGIISNIEEGRRCSGNVFGSAAFYFGPEKAEINSQEWEKRLLDFVSRNIPGGIVAVLDEPDFPIVCFTRKLLEYTDSTYEELMQVTGGFFSRLICEEDRRMVAREIKKQLASKDSYELYYRIVDARGERVWVYDVGRYAVNENGKRFIMSCFLDVTDEMEQKAELRIINESSMDGVFRAAMTEGFPVLYANDGYYRIHGYTRAEFARELGGKAELCVYPEDLARVTGEIERAINEKEEKLVLEYRIRRRDGKTAWIHMVGSIYTLPDGRTGLVGLVLDITKRRLLEEELLHTDWLYKMIRSHTKMKVWEFDVESRTIIADKPSGGQETIRNVPDCFVERGKIYEGSVEEFRRLHDEIIGGAERACAVIQINRGNGEISWEKLSYIAFRNAQGKNVRALGISEDVTQQREAELRAFHYEKMHRSLAADFLYDFRLNITTNTFEEGWTESKENPIAAGTRVTYQDVHEAILGMIVQEDDRKRFQKYYSYERILEYAKMDGFTQEFEYRQRYKDGGIIWVSLKIKVIASPMNGDKIMFAHAKNIDDLKRREFALSQKSRIDKESGFYHPKTAGLLIQSIIEDTKSRSCLAIINADAFERVNRAGGYATGDDILRQMAEIIQRQLRTDSVPVRLGGDMFLVYFYNIGQQEHVRAAVRQLQRSLSGSYVVGTLRFQITVSVGAAEFFPTERKSYTILYENASQALAAAKREGGNRTAFYDEVFGELWTEEQTENTGGEEIAGLMLEAFRQAEEGTPSEDIYRMILAYLGGYCRAEAITLFGRGGQSAMLRRLAFWLSEDLLYEKEETDFDPVAFEELLAQAAPKSFLFIRDEESSSYEGLCRLYGRENVECPVLLAGRGTQSEWICGLVIENPQARAGGMGRLEKVLELMERIAYLDRLKRDYHNTLSCDQETGVGNYHNYRKRIQGLSEDVLTSLGIVEVQLVDLKAYNKEYGEDKADACIQFTAQLLKETFYDRTCYRVGRNSFVALCENMTYESFAERCKKMRESLTGKYPDWVVSADVWESPVISIRRLREQVEEKLAVTRSQKKNISGAASGQMVQETLKKLQTAMKKGEYLAFLQPKADVKTGRICGAEALVRYRSREGKILTPGAFLGELEHMGLIRYIDLFVLEEVCLLLKKWIEDGMEPVPISLNYSRKTILEEGILAETNRIVEQYEIPKSLIEIEVTESISSIDRTSLKRIADGFVREGYRIAMDDYGADYSNIYILYSLELHTLKLDRRLVDDIWHDKKARVIVENIIEVCRKLGIVCVAEGVETREQLGVLKDMNCDVYQGYFINKPIDVEEFTRLYISREALAKQ